MATVAIRTAYPCAHQNPADVFFAKLYATGTLVGDSIGINRARNVFSKGRDPEKTLTVGSASKDREKLSGAGSQYILVSLPA